MKHTHIEPDLLVRYLANETTGQEQATVQQWIKARPENRQTFKELELIWKQSANRSDFEKKYFSADAGWVSLSKKMHEVESFEHTSRHHEPIDYDISRKSFWPALFRVAAIFLVAGLIGLFAYQNWAQPVESPKEPALREITTAMGQRVNLTLSDGSKVLLNAGSTLRLPQVFEADKREVFLEGQAYFNVAKNPEKPFIINSEDTKTRVLGTSFSVRAYPDDKQILVAVKEGRVSFETTNELGNQQVILHEHELAQFNIQSHQLQSGAIDDLALYLGWVDGYLKFKESPMAEVAVQLERRYGVEVSFANARIKDLLLTALLKSRSIQNVLDVISTSLNINYRLNENQVVFFDR